MIQPTVQPYNLFRPQDLEHQGNVRQAQPPHTPGQQLVSQPARQDAQMAQQAEARARQTAYNTPAQPVQTVSQPASSPIQQKPVTSTDELAAALGYTSPQEEERLRKASVMNQRIMAFGDAIRHIGNIANTVNYAPPQQFNNPVAEEEARYQRGKALRDKANLTYYNYMMQKAKQDAQQRQWEAEQKAKADQWNATFKFNAAKTAAELAEKQRQYNQNYEFNLEKEKRAADQWKQNYEQKERHYKQSQSLGWFNANTSRMNAVNKGKEDNEKNVIYSRRGYLTFPGATEHDLKNIYDNMYEWGKSRGYINENSIIEGVSPDLFGGKKISDVSKREAVNKMVMEHDDAAVQLHHKHRGKWHEQKPNDKKDSYSQYIVQPQGTSTSGTDYSQYLRK